MIKFTVDGNLPKVDGVCHEWPAKELVVKILNSNNRISYNYLFSSFESKELIFFGRDCFFKTILRAFQEHKSLVLSPDMIWLKILQTASRHINDNPNLYKSMFSDGQEKATLVLQTDEDIFRNDVKWNLLLDSFESTILRNINGKLRDALLSDFSTTTPIEKIACQISVMDMTKSYYEFVAHRMICGIPEIILKGTTSDWNLLLEKADSLSVFKGLTGWIEDIKPILKEFIRASEGTINKNFWRSIVMKRHPEELPWRGCGIIENPSLTGWILKFYSFDYDAEILNKFKPALSMKSETVGVSWLYTLDNGFTTRSFPMEFWAGFVGTEYDKDSDSFTPVIGWFVRESDNDTDLAKTFIEVCKSRNIMLRLNGAVPPFLKKIGEMDTLNLDFGNQFVDLPTWVDSLPIGSLQVFGKYHRGDKAKLKARFPNGKFQ